MKTQTDKATARPWTIRNKRSSLTIWGDISVCLVSKYSNNHKANAELIVKAVNNHESLLEACEEALALVKQSPWGKDNPWCYEKIEQTIKKARG